MVPLCKSCLEQLSLLELRGRCSYCLTPSRFGSCRSCRESRHYFGPLISAFENYGPATSLLKEFADGDRPHLAKSFAASMAIQYIRSRRPLPTFIVPVPQPVTEMIKRGYDPNLLLAEELGRLFNRPVVRLLKRVGLTPPQEGKHRLQRIALPRDVIQWQTEYRFIQKSLLLVDTNSATQTTLRCCALRLRESYPSAIFALTFIKSFPGE